MPRSKAPKEIVWVEWSTAPQRGSSGKIISARRRRKFSSRNEAATFVMESKEIGDNYRHTAQMAVIGAMFLFDHIKRIYESSESDPEI